MVSGLGLRVYGVGYTSRLERRFPERPKWRRLKLGSVGHVRMRLQCAFRLITPAGRFSTCRGGGRVLSCQKVYI